MFLRDTTRRKNGKEHRYYSLVENRRVASGRVVQRHALYLGEINDSQEEAWRKTIEIFQEGQARPRTVALFPEDRIGAVADTDIVRIRLSQLYLHRPRQWGACWLTGQLWEQLGLDRFWAARLPPSRKGTRWDWVLQILVAYRLLDPGSEWRLYRHWFEHSARADLLRGGFLYPTDRGGGGLQKSQGRFEPASYLSSVGTSDRSPHFHLLFGLRPARHAAPAPARLGPGSYATLDPGKIRHHADARYASCPRPTSAPGS